jgi:hypothetical protein
MNPRRWCARRSRRLGIALLGGMLLWSGIVHVAPAPPASAQSPKPAPPAPARERPRPASEPAASPPVSTDATTAREAPTVDDARAEQDRQRQAATIVVPRGGPGPTVAIPLGDGLVGGRLGAGELPPAWSLKRFAGRAQFELARDDGRPAFRLASRASSFALHRDVVVDVGQFPVLTWSWKVVRLPARGDVRDPRADDQAAQVYLVFPRSPSARTSSDVLGYVWDTRAPVGAHATHRQWQNVRVVVVESGDARAGQWVREERNVRDDYQALFGRPAPPLGRIAVMTDSDHTGGQTEAWFADIALQRTGVPVARPAGRN